MWARYVAWTEHRNRIRLYLSLLSKYIQGLDAMSHFCLALRCGAADKKTQKKRVWHLEKIISCIAVIWEPNKVGASIRICRNILFQASVFTIVPYFQRTRFSPTAIIPYSCFLMWAKVCPRHFKLYSWKSYILGRCARLIAISECPLTQCSYYALSWLYFSLWKSMHELACSTIGL